MSPEVRQELQHLLSALCEGDLTEAQHTRLQELLDRDEECRRLYLEYLDLHARLLTHPGLGAGPATPSEQGHAAVAANGASPDVDETRSFPTPSEPIPAGRGKVRQALRYALVAAGTLAASLLVQLFWWHPQRPDGPSHKASGASKVEPHLPGYVATLTWASSCTWEKQPRPLLVGARLLPGELRLQKGIARIRFDSGPDLVIEGPAVLRLDSRTAATLLRGKVVFKGDETGAPFDLHTPSSTLVDFGTQYALAVGAEGEEIHVFDGEVRRTPAAPNQAAVETLTTGQARRYDAAPASPGQEVPLDQERFARQLANPDDPPADPTAGLLAYEGFDYKDPDSLRLNRANGGFGWATPWKGFARPLFEGDQNRLALNVTEGLGRPGAAVPGVGGCFDYTGFSKYYRRLATPVRMDADGVYYLSFLFRRQGPPADPLNAVAVLLRTSEDVRTDADPSRRLNIGVGGVNHLFTHLNRVGLRTPLPLKYGETYLLVAKIVASSSNAGQVFLRVYGPEELVEREEPGSWSVVGPPFPGDLVFDWLEVHINSKTRQTMDELRLGTTWSSVTAPWIGTSGLEKPGKP
jgi:ferric-dicitrate binding protein FerR (iron transport regulator)